MKNLILFSAFSLCAYTAGATDLIRVNNIGYLTDDIKAAVYLGEQEPQSLNFVIESARGKMSPDSVVTAPAWSPFAHSARVYFSTVEAPGDYAIVAYDGDKEISRANVYVGDDAYSRLAIHELPLNYLREQRCGDNPVFGSPCHQHDGYMVLSGERDGEAVDVRGGWHDASDFLQYLPTSANTVYQLLFAYAQNPDVWADHYDATGRPGADGVADILDEARYGIEWMQRMNPEEGLYFNQIADDRDHRFAGLPADDNVDYGWGAGAGRPVYPCSDRPYGLEDNKNRSFGLASSVGKFASTFALGAEVFADIDPAFAIQLKESSLKAYDLAKAHPGACQTAPCISPYFYEEDNYSDDLQLAAASIYRLSGDPIILTEAVNYGRMEPVTPWMGADSARHYQWYPFVNLGHYYLAASPDKKIANEFARNMRSGLSRVDERGRGNAFRVGHPFIWCSNNLAVAYVTQGMLYREATGDNSYLEAETAMRDWLFGCNPWGQVMMMLPIEMSSIPSPTDPHSTIIDREIGGLPGRHWLTGGLVDGPVYASIFNSLRGVYLRNADEYADIQNPYVVYHDDYSDYSTNEPTMDGTASLTYMLGRLAQKK